MTRWFYRQVARGSFQLLVQGGGNLLSLTTALAVNPAQGVRANILEPVREA